MLKKPTFYFILFSFIASCERNASKTYDYTLLKFDTSKIYIFKWDTALYTFPKFSKPLALTNDDFKLADTLLSDVVEKFNQVDSKKFYDVFSQRVSIDSFTIHLAKYKRQYFPYEDNNGQRVIQVVCFSKPFADWRDKIYSYEIGGGISRLDLRINLSARKVDEFSTGGWG